ncbi:MAG: TIR domain-containing protein, partial [Nitrospirales bacterium]|nr:TIR domain-containing protein [Nitrospirales bacterium]
MFDVFLSYNRQDGDVVRRIAEKLKQARIAPWLDTWCLTPGKPWQAEMASGLLQSSSCAVFVGPADLGDWEREELGLALDRAVKERGFRIFLVLLPGFPEPFDVTKLHPFLSTRTWVDFRGGFQSARLFQPLVNAIKGVPYGPDLQCELQQTDRPYRGLQVFDEEHAKWYFGRNGEIQRVLEKLKISRFLAIVGPSGSGKSSLARAGLIPRLREGALPGSDTWPISVLCPGSNPLASLAALLLRIHPAEGMPQTVDSLSNDPRTLHLAASLLLSQKPSTARMFLLIDQFEEIFTLCSSEEERTSFLENLVYAGSQPGGKLTVVLTMRADFYPKCAAYPDFSTRLASHQFLVSPMSEDGLRQAIEAPAHLLNHEFEEGLVDTILKDVSAQPGALPLLEYALMELWDRRRGRLLTLEGYREIGGIEGALAQRADSIFQQFSPIEQGFVRQLMLRLTQPGEGTEDTRRRTEIGQLSLSHSKGSMDHVVHAMVNSRLLTVSRDETTNQENLIEVSHEALIRGWPKLRQWIDADREGIREHHRINEAAQEWKGMKGQ